MASFSKNLIAGTSNVAAKNAPIPEPLFSAVSSDNEIMEVEHAYAEDQVKLSRLTTDSETRAQQLVDMKVQWEFQRKEKVWFNVEREAWEQEEVGKREESRRINLEVHGQNWCSDCY